ncbi:EF-hand domain-containing protein [Amycolatopsis nigrescens]|uniref:EF-hand domain-containing protein n=1 Tax=Amycolatopsis nigrescens TaxID=381445 RepID=UPI000364BD19|nr:EF-hand domain-containing protein [Amycolatopsis nigrescens]
MASELQRRKVTGVFYAMDANKDGLLEKSDFEALTARWTGVRDWAPGSPGYRRLSEIMMGWWEVLLAVSDADRDGKVTLDEVLVVVDGLAENPGPVAETAAAMFEAVDENADGRISAAEYRQLVETWSGAPADTDAVFPLLDLNADGYLSQEEFTELWIEFWAGDDPDAAGTWVFGRFDLPMVYGG